MSKEKSGPPWLVNLSVNENQTEFIQTSGIDSPPDAGEPSFVRAQRAKLIEEISYRLTDLITIISARLEILGEQAPSTLRGELLRTRDIAIKGVEFSKLLLRAAQDCRREINM